MKKLFIITGANGHLGGTIVRMLNGRPVQVRGLVFGDKKKQDTGSIHYYSGDVREPETLRPLFEGCEDMETIVIHTAGIIDISNHVSPELYDVNVNGTKNILALCREYPVKRLVYVSSVHAIPEQKRGNVTGEIRDFSPDAVVGGYAKTKAEATREVRRAAQEGLDAVVVHPSGILGPYDRSGNHLVQMDAEYLDFPSGSFDVVVSRNLTWNLRSPEKAYAHWVRVLKPGGLLLNFDANWYRYLYDTQAEEGHRSDRENVRTSGAADDTAGTDVAAMESIARRAPLSAHDRPGWDFGVLAALGMDVSADTEIWRRVWTREEWVNNASTPMFLVEAVKKPGIGADAS